MLDFGINQCLDEACAQNLLVVYIQEHFTELNKPVVFELWLNLLCLSCSCQSDSSIP